MNVDRIIQLADFVEANTSMEFDMRSIRHCFIGFGKKLFGDGEFGYTSYKLSEDLDVPYSKADEMCFPHHAAEAVARATGADLDDDSFLRKLTREQGVAMLRNLAATGEVKW